MNQFVGPRAMLLAGLLAAGCATHATRPAAGGAHLPIRYRASQVILVSLASGTFDFLGSVVRDGRRVEVVLFDPALQVPLLRAVGDDDDVSETTFLEGVPPGYGRRLVGLLRALHEAGYGPDGTAVGDGWHFQLSGFSGPPGCWFPRHILLEHAHGGPRVEVESTDVACGETGP